MGRAFIWRSVIEGGMIEDTGIKSLLRVAVDEIGAVGARMGAE